MHLPRIESRADLARSAAVARAEAAALLQRQPGRRLARFCVLSWLNVEINGLGRLVQPEQGLGMLRAAVVLAVVGRSSCLCKPIRGEWCAPLVKANARHTTGLTLRCRHHSRMR